MIGKIPGRMLLSLITLKALQDFILKSINPSALCMDTARLGTKETLSGARGVYLYSLFAKFSIRTNY